MSGTDAAGQPVRMRQAAALATVLLALLTLLAPAAGHPADPATSAQGGGVLPGEAAAAADTIVLPATVVAYKSALVTAKVAGFLERIAVDKGDKVRAGELIAQLEVPELQADQIRDRAQVDVARRVYERMQRASRTAPDLVTPDSLDTARGQFEVAKATLDRDDALLAYARVTAPFSGTVTARFVDPGAFIPVPSRSTQQSAAIVSLMDFSRVRIQMWVPEVDAHRVRPGCSAQFTALALPGRHFAGSITRVSYALQNQSRTMLAEIDMANPGEVLQPGMYLSVTLTLERKAAGS